jgi:hypothetical protein
VAHVYRLLAVWAFVAQIPAVGQAVPPARAALDFLNHNRPVLDAHNCYPYRGDWADRIERALKTGYWIRFYTLDGFTPGEDRGWGNTYNFGSHDAVLARWRAVLAAGVNLIVSDQYKELAGVMRQLGWAGTSP